VRNVCGNDISRSKPISNSAGFRSRGATHGIPENPNPLRCIWTMNMCLKSAGGLEVPKLEEREAGEMIFDDIHKRLELIFSQPELVP
jgi:hypothetical protein